MRQPLPAFIQAARQPNTLRWKWHYRTTKGSAGPSIRASGKFVSSRDRNGDGYVEVLAIKGQRNGDRITGLFPSGESIPGNFPYTGDNLIRKNNASRDPQLNTNGFQFALENGSYSNVFFASFLTPSTYLDFHSVSPFPNGAVAPNSEIAVVFKARII